MPPGPSSARRFLSRAALGLWLLAVGLLGLLRAAGKVAGDPGWTQDPVTLAWLVGSVAVLAWGAVATARALRRPRGGRR